MENTINKINEMLGELQNIVNELETVSTGIASISDFQKVGNDTGVLTITDAKDKLLNAKRTLS